MDINALIFLDMSLLTISLVLAHLSKRLGEALKTPPYYRLYYLECILLVIAIFTNTISINNLIAGKIETLRKIAMVIRFISGIIAVITTIQYWKWLFAEYLKK